MASRLVLRRDDYQVAWICALTIETAAASQMLDKRHAAIAQHETDDNVYVFGEVSGINVVIVSPSMTAVETVVSGKMLRQLATSFPAITMALSIGIAGGLPTSSQDIHLGDVVVGVPQGFHTGSVRVDLPALSEGPTRRLQAATGAAPQVALSAVAQLRASHEIEKPALFKHFSDMLVDDTRLLTVFEYPGLKNDRLFKGHYVHKNGRNDCAACDLEQTVARPCPTPDQPQIHYGLIASSRTVLKDALLRDRIANEYDVLCLDSETADMGDSLPCLSIRGVCDYADTHRHSKWRSYAAATASAYAKQLTSVLSLQSIKALSSIGSRTGVSADGQGMSLDRVFTVPISRNAQFFGREDTMQRMRSRLKSFSSVCLLGLGGIGKTQIAAEYAYRVRDEEPETNILWIDASTRESLVNSCHKIVSSLRPQEQLQPYSNSYLSLVKWLRQSQATCLIVLDNFDEDDDDDSDDDSEDDDIATNGTDETVIRLRKGQFAKDLLSKCLTPGKSLILTTRSHIIAERLAGQAKITRVAPLSLDESASTLLELLAPSDESTATSDPDLTQLVNLLGGVPLAITQAAGFITKEGLTIQQYIEIVADSERQLDEVFKRVGYSSSISENLKVMFQLLREREPAAADLLSILVMFDEPVPEYLLRISEDQKAGLRKEIVALIDFGWIVLDREQLSFSTHKLARYVIRHDFLDEELDEHFSGEALKILSSRFPIMAYKDKKQYDAIIRLSRSFLHHTSYQNLNPIHRGDVMRKVGRFEFANGNFCDALKILEDALRVTEEIHDETEANSVTTELRQNVCEVAAEVFYAVGEYSRAEPLYEEVLRLRCPLAGLNDLHRLRLLKKVGLASLSYHNFGKALSTLEALIAEWKPVLGQDHPEILSIRSNFSLSFMFSRKLDEAEPYLRQTFEGCQEVLGPEHPDTLSSMSYLAACLYGQGKFREALPLAQKYFQALVTVLGETHPDTLSSMENLARIYRENRMLSEAADMGQRALELYDDMVNPTDEGRISCQLSLATTYSLKGELMKSKALYRDILEAAEKAGSADSPTIVHCRVGLANVLEKEGQLRHALQELQKAYNSTKLTIGDDNERATNLKQAIQDLQDRVSDLAATPEENRESLPTAEKKDLIYGTSVSVSQKATHKPVTNFVNTSGHNGNTRFSSSSIRARRRDKSRELSELKIMTVEELHEWVEQNRASFRPIYGRNSLPKDCSAYFDMLTKRDHVFLVDDSKSMAPYWHDVVRLFADLAYFIKQFETEGIDLYFASSNEQIRARNNTPLVTSVRRARNKLTKQSDVAFRLISILKDYNSKLAKAKARAHLSRLVSSTTIREVQRPISIYVLTDGTWILGTDASAQINKALKDMLRLLNRQGIDQNQVSIQFIRFGDNLYGQSRLQRLAHMATELEEDESSPTYHMCDATSADGNVWKMLLGGVKESFVYDSDESDESEPGGSIRSKITRHIRPMWDDINRSDRILGSLGIREGTAPTDNSR